MICSAAPARRSGLSSMPCSVHASSSPLYTACSLYTLQSNSRFSHNKATREPGYAPRDLIETIRDTVRWRKREDVEAIPL